MEEIKTMEKMGCWEVLDIERMPDGCVPIGCKLVLKLKFRDGVYDKHRARLDYICLLFFMHSTLELKYPARWLWATCKRKAVISMKTSVLHVIMFRSF